MAGKRPGKPPQPLARATHSGTLQRGAHSEMELRARVEHWGGGVVKVELTDRERAAFAAIVRATAPVLIGDIERQDPSLTGDAADRLLAALAIPRTGRPLWESLATGARGHGARTTTFRLHRRSALVWANLLLVPVAGRDEWAGLSRRTRLTLAKIASRLVLVSFAHRGGRRVPKVNAEEAVRLLSAVRRRGAGAIKATAARLACDERAIGRALKRHERERSAYGQARAFLERVAALRLGATRQPSGAACT